MGISSQILPSYDRISTTVATRLSSPNFLKKIKYKMYKSNLYVVYTYGRQQTCNGDCKKIARVKNKVHS